MRDSECHIRDDMSHTHVIERRALSRDTTLYKVAIVNHFIMNHTEPYDPRTHPSPVTTEISEPSQPSRGSPVVPFIYDECVENVYSTHVWRHTHQELTHVREELMALKASKDTEVKALRADVMDLKASLDQVLNETTKRDNNSIFGQIREAFRRESAHSRLNEELLQKLTQVLKENNDLREELSAVKASKGVIGMEV